MDSSIDFLKNYYPLSEVDYTSAMANASDKGDHQMKAIYFFDKIKNHV